jgi:PIN domain nuclease of toxin-antitoxin system
VKLLLDTQVFLWVINNQKLSRQARDAFLDTGNQLFLSAASYWEICIKQSIGKLGLAEDWQQSFEREMRANDIRWLPIEKAHCQAIIALPWIHRDPFDRLLIGQALHEGMTIPTSDEQIRQYAVATIW